MKNHIVPGSGLFQGVKVTQICPSEVEVIPFKMVTYEFQATRAEVVIDGYLAYLNQPIYKVTANETRIVSDKTSGDFFT
jgi:hypothetical protein